jgi:hypothetical protein
MEVVPSRPLIEWLEMTAIVVVVAFKLLSKIVSLDRKAGKISLFHLPD